MMSRSEVRPCAVSRAPRRISRLVSESANCSPSCRRMSARLCSSSICMASTKRPSPLSLSAAANASISPVTTASAPVPGVSHSGFDQPSQIGSESRSE